MELVIGAVIGICAGILGGLFGIGGGILIVPACIYLLGFTQARAQGTSLVALLLPVGILGVLNYAKAGNVDWRTTGRGRQPGATAPDQVQRCGKSGNTRIKISLGMRFGESKPVP